MCAFHESEFVSRAILKWLGKANIDSAHIDPGKPWQSGSMEWFRNRIDAKIVIEQLRRQYDEGLT